jgi:hypothetical protein
MGHWEQTGEWNMRHRERISPAGARRRKLTDVGGIVSIAALALVLWFLMIAPILQLFRS